MSTVSETVTFPCTLLPTAWSLADVQRHVDDVPIERIRLDPPPGMATEADALELREREGRLYELIDGVLVEKPMGTYESLLAVALQNMLHAYFEEHPLGVIVGEGGPLCILPERMRFPDVSVTSGRNSPIVGSRASACCAWRRIWRWRFSRKAIRSPRCN